MSKRRFASLAADLLSRQGASEATPQTTRHGSPVVAFIIGLAIVLLASILNAAGLNITKLDHVRWFCASVLIEVCPDWDLFLSWEIGTNQCDTQGATKEGLVAAVMVTRNDTLHVRRREFLSFHLLIDPLPFGWMYRLSQLIGSTLALDYLRAGE